MPTERPITFPAAAHTPATSPMPSVASFRRPNSSRRLQATCRASSKVQCAARAQHRAQKQRVPLATKYDVNSNVQCTAAPSTSKLVLPRTLLRPVLREVDSAPLVAAYPSLAGVPAEYIRDRLPERTPTMRAALAAVQISLSKSRLPSEVQILINDAVAAACPTHMLAVYSDAPLPSGDKRPVRLFPIHDLVFAAHCAALPALPPSQPRTRSPRATLPVVPLRLPSPDTFALLHGYLYTQSLAALAPPCDADLLQLATHAHRIHGLWSNACELGVVDERLYAAVEEAWVRTLGAMQACS